MSGWGSWFGGGAAAKKDAPKKAILALREQLEMLSKREKHLETQIAALHKVVMANVKPEDEITQKPLKRTAANDAAAKFAMRKKKPLELQYEQTKGQISTLEREIYSIESANINKETLQAMKQAQQALKQIHGGITVDKVDQTMEDLREQHAIADEINEAITQGAGASAVDEEDLDAELEALQQEMLDEEMLKIGTVPQDRVGALPSAPQGVAGRAAIEEEDDEEAELRKLQAEMAM